MKKPIQLLFILCLITLFSCQKEIEFEGADLETKTVVNSVFTSENRWTVDVSKTKSVLSNEDIQKVENAVVTISNTHGWAEQLTNKGEGKYASNFTPQPGVEYFISVKDEDGTNLSAVNQLPSKIPIDNATVSTYINSDGGKRYKAAISFQDPLGQNYYSISFFYLNLLGNIGDILENGLTDTSYGVIPVPTVYVNDPDLQSLVKINSGLDIDKGQNWYTSIKGLYFTDEFFDGQHVTLEFEMDPEDVEDFLDDTGGTLIESFLFYSLNFLSEDYFLYNSTLDRQISSNGDPTAQPVRVYSNIHNGLGIFAGYSTVSDSIKIK